MGIVSRKIATQLERYMVANGVDPMVAESAAQKCAGKMTDYMAPAAMAGFLIGGATLNPGAVAMAAFTGGGAAAYAFFSTHECKDVRNAGFQIGLSGED